MTTVLPQRTGTTVDEDHLTAWAAGYLTAAATTDQHAYQQGHQAGYEQALHHVCTRIVEVENLNRHLWDAARVEAANWAARRRADTELAYRQQLEREGRQEYRGGPVAWEPEQPVQPAAWRNHDRGSIAAGLAYQPNGDWRVIHHNVEPGTWLRIWADLSDRTRASVGDLDPTRPRRVAGSWS